MTAIQVARCGPGDRLAEALRLITRFFAEEGFTTPPEVIAANLELLAANPNCGLFLASAGDQAIGVATVSLEFGIEFGWWAEMGDLYVVPEWRGQGVSRTLVDTVEAFLKEKGAKGYQVTVTPDAETHHGLTQYYRSLGFASEGRVILAKEF